MPLYFCKANSMIVIRRHACNDSIIHFHLLQGNTMRHTSLSEEPSFALYTHTSTLLAWEQWGHFFFLLLYYSFSSFTILMMMIHYIRRTYITSAKSFFSFSIIRPPASHPPARVRIELGVHNLLQGVQSWGTPGREYIHVLLWVRCWRSIRTGKTDPISMWT